MFMNKICLAAFLVLVSAPRAVAFIPYLSDFKSVYPFTAGTRLDSCQVCHVHVNPGTVGQPADRNSYGLAYAGQTHGVGQSANNQSAVSAIANSDSDGDGVSNGSEISSLTFPGNSGDFPVTPPSITQQP